MKTQYSIDNGLTWQVALPGHLTILAKGQLIIYRTTPEAMRASDEPMDLTTLTWIWEKFGPACNDDGNVLKFVRAIEAETIHRMALRGIPPLSEHDFYRMRDVIVGLRDGWATRGDAAAALAIIDAALAADTPSPAHSSGAVDRDSVLEEAAMCAEQQNRVGREWVKDSLWDAIIRRVPEAIRRLKSAAPTAQQSLTAGGAVPEGWKLVPLEPSDEMTAIGQGLRYACVYSIGEIYRRMITAAPLPQVQSEALDTGMNPAFETDGNPCGYTWPTHKVIRRSVPDQQPITPFGAPADNDDGVAK